MTLISASGMCGEQKKKEAKNHGDEKNNPDRQGRFLER